jgi:hypothetical protein
MRNYKQVQDVPQNDIPTIQPIYVTSGGGAIVVIAILVFSVVVIFVTSRDENSGWAGIWGTAAFFTIATTIGLLAVNGGLASMFGDWQREKTIRSRDKHEYKMWHAEMSMRVMPPAQLPDSQPTESLQPAALIESPNYVSAAPNDRQMARNAKAWAATALYLEDGQPNPDAVNLKGGTEAAGRLKTAAPSNPEVKQFLLDRKVLLRVRQGMALNLEQYPTRESLRWLTR